MLHFIRAAIILLSSMPLIESISTDETLTRFYLWTKDNPSNEQELLFDDLASIEMSHFNAKRQTKVLVHGYTGNGKQGWVTTMRNHFLQKGP